MHPFAHRGSFPPPLRAIGLLLLLSALLAGRTVAAQDTAPFTLHVYTDLVQLPTLVLDSEQRPMAPVDPGKFNLSLDSGPRFHPVHVRREGDDPIDLAILFDLSGSQSQAMPAFQQAFSSWIFGSLSPRDTVSLYAVDCTTIRTADNVPADPDRLRTSLENALSSTAIHGGKKKPACGNKDHLWDSLYTMAHRLSTLPGRRVILTLSDGSDGASHITPTDLHLYAASQSVTIFGLTVLDAGGPISSGGPASRSSGRRNTSSSSVTPASGENPFDIVCQLTGGLVLRVPGEKDIPKNLRLFVAMLRGRYILEFPRPSNGEGGHHDIEVTLDRTVAFIRSSGISFPVQDPSLAADPNYVPSADPNRAPTLGKRRPIN
jgi:VWFA-related protein